MVSKREETLKKIAKDTIDNIQWWRDRCGEEPIRESMTRTIDSLKYVLKEYSDHENG